MDFLSNFIDSYVDATAFGDALIQFGIGALKLLVILAIGFWVRGIIMRLAKRAFDRTSFDETMENFILSSARATLSFLVLIIAVSSVGVDVVALSALLAGLGLALGGLISGMLQDVASGVLLLVRRPFAKDDVISSSGETGMVLEVGITHVLIQTPDNREIYLPNSVVLANKFTVFGPEKRVDIKVPVNYAEYDEALAILKSIGDDYVHRVDGHMPVIMPWPESGLTPSGIDILFAVTVPTSVYWGAMSELQKMVWEQFREAGLTISRNQLEVQMLPGSEITQRSVRSAAKKPAAK